jgi:hypothetical protein
MNLKVRLPLCEMNEMMVSATSNYAAATESELAKACKGTTSLGLTGVLNQGPDEARVAPGGDHSIVVCKC